MVEILVVSCVTISKVVIVTIHLKQSRARIRFMVFNATFNNI